MPKILIVEDNSLFRKTLRESLLSVFPSFAIREAKNGNEALQMIPTFLPDLIFMDIRLPGQNGLQLTGKIKESYPDILIVILTSCDLPEYREAAAQFKADHFLSKDSGGADKIFKLVEIMLSRKGINGDGSNSTKATA